MSQIISHIKHDDSGKWAIQTNDSHCEGVGRLASGFAAEFGMSAWGLMLGLMHDRGKESNGFQTYIKRESGYDTSARSDMPKSHSLAGAILTKSDRLDPLRWLSNAIAGHHRGLYDTGELDEHLSEPFPQGVRKDIPDIALDRIAKLSSPPEISHIGRMLFSCLVDADWLDTERFMMPSTSDRRGNYDNLATLKNRLDTFCARFSSLPPSHVNNIRNEIQQACNAKASAAPGFFTLTVPTGGGKTIASMVWAIDHAIANNKKRIILAIPYTSIIVQTAQVLKGIFGEKNVIEHHSAMAPTDDDNDATISNRLACENWDAPIVVTTNVQLFESMFANKPSRCRKLHSICNSVVILDEIQTLPLDFYQPIVDAMKSYVARFGVSFMFSTASQPVLDGKRRGMGGSIFEGIPADAITDIVAESVNLHERLRRVEMKFDPTPVSIADIAADMSNDTSILCIVNSRRRARELFEALPADDNYAHKFHLSRMMCQAHILQQIEEIKRCLEENKRPVKVVSTQLIEAGVDIDFPVVFRQLAGLDSLLQAAGRCNREGKLQSGLTRVFQLEGEKSHGSIAFASDAMKRLLNLNPSADWFSPSVMNEYFRMLYANTPSFDRHNIGKLLGNPRNCHYEEASRKFQMIDDADSVSVIVNFGEAPGLIDELKSKGSSRTIARRLGRFSINISKSTFASLVKHGLVEEPSAGFFYIPFKEQYDSRLGLLTESFYTENTIII